MYYYHYYNDFNETHRAGLQFLHATIDVLNNIHPRMSVSTVQTLLYIAGSQDPSAPSQINLTELGKQLRVPYSTLIRHIEILGEGTPTKIGLNLVERVSIPGQRKEQYVRLSYKGIDLFSEVKSTFEKYRSHRDNNSTSRNGTITYQQQDSHLVAHSPHPPDETD
jgi:DNA-binding MarR family transcriptional regulator